MNPDDDHAEQLAAARERLHTLNALVAALERRDEISLLIADSDDVAAARTALATLLQTDEVAAQGVLTLHWSAFTRARRQQAHEDLDDMRAAVQALENGPDQHPADQG